MQPMSRIIAVAILVVVAVMAAITVELIIR
jgi:hypothetical protein